MSKRVNLKEDKIIVRYENKEEGKEEKSLQQVMQRLFNSYIKKVIQNINKGK